MTATRWQLVATAAESWIDHWRQLVVMCRRVGALIVLVAMLGSGWAHGMLKTCMGAMYRWEVL